MKKIILLFAAVGITFLAGCSGDTGPQGPQGNPGPESEVFELRNVNFSWTGSEYQIYRTLNPVIYQSDNILIYRMSGLINSTTPIWQLIPRTLYLNEGELDYDFDFSLQDFTIYAGGTYDLSLTPQFLNNQTFRIVIIPGYFSNRMIKDGTVKSIDFNNYEEVISYFGIDDTHVQVIP